MLLFPFYFFEKGSPQLADVFGVIFITTFISYRFTSFYNEQPYFFKSLSGFIICTFIINSIYGLIFRDFTAIKYSVNYLYCLCMAAAVLDRTKTKSLFIPFTIQILIASCLIQLLLLFVYGYTDFRGLQTRTALYFNNPNQLALWSILLLTISSVFIKHKSLSFLFFLGVTLYFITISGSKAGIISYCLMLIILLLKNVKFLPLLLSIIIAIVGCSLFIQKDTSLLMNAPIIKQFVDREEEDTSEFDNNLMGRGFDRMVEHPKYLIFGAGEGRNIRFNKYGHELHGTFASVLFCYGIIPFLLFISVFYRILTKNTYSNLLLIIPLIAFSFAHMTLRIPLYWIVFSLFYIPNLLPITTKNS